MIARVVDKSWGILIDMDKSAIACELSREVEEEEYVGVVD